MSEKIMSLPNKLIPGTTPVVEALSKVSFPSFIPSGWFSSITFINRKPYFLAMLILADTLSWYKKVEIRDEITGQITYGKHFKADKLQRSYRQISEKFKCSEREATAAVQRLRDLNLLTIEFRHFKGSSNVMFIEPIPEDVIKITHPDYEDQPPMIPKKSKKLSTPMSRSNVTSCHVQTLDDVTFKRDTYTYNQNIRPNIRTLVSTTIEEPPVIPPTCTQGDLAKQPPPTIVGMTHASYVGQPSTLSAFDKVALDRKLKAMRAKGEMHAVSLQKTHKTLLEEVVWHVEHRDYTRLTIKHAVNAASKMLREGKWGTPKGMVEELDKTLLEDRKKEIEAYKQPKKKGELENLLGSFVKDISIK